MRWWLAVLLVPLVAGQPQLTAVVPDLPGAHDHDEAVAITSPVAWDLTGYGLTDGEDTWWFPAGSRLEAGVETWVVGNETAWAMFDGPPAHWTFDLRLGNQGDDVTLMGPGGGVDSMVYDDVMVTGQAQVLRRDDDWVTPRIHRLGESNLDRPTFTGAATLYASPDNSHEVLLGLLGQATERVHLHVYQLGLPSLVDAVAAAAERGVDVQILVEDHPVGTSREEKHEANQWLGQIVAAGGEAVRAGSVRYAFHHLKVLIADDTVALQSENWVRTGVPVDPSWGNRGWGVAVHDGAMADWFATWMAADRAAWDTEPAESASGQPVRMPAPRGAYAPIRPEWVEELHITPVISPDHTADPAQDPVLALIQDACCSIDVQQLDLRLQAANAMGWSGPDGLSYGLAEAAARGVMVRVQAAEPFHRDDTGNREVLAWLEARGVSTRELDRDGLVTLHNKGLIVDDRWVVIGSMNGNHHSRSNNREASVILDSPEAADYYGALFDADWVGASSRDWNQVARDLEEIPVSPWPMLLALMAVVWLQRCSPRFP
ncbi:MAG: phospholipase D-like domain-containing protein [Thermoplasmatota archaeon]